MSSKSRVAFCMATVAMLMILSPLLIYHTKAQELPSNEQLQISGSTIITQPFEDFFNSLNIDIGQGNPYFTKIQNQIQGTTGEFGDIFTDIQKLLELLEGLTQIVFDIFISFLHFLGSILDKTQL